MKKQLLPPHLENLAIDIAEKKQNVKFKLRCPCGGEQFEVSECNTHTNEPKKGFHWPILTTTGMVDQDTGMILTIHKTFFGIPVKKEYTPLPNKNLKLSRTVVKIKCLNCGEEYVVFDSSIHGYDGICAKIESREFHPLKPDVRVRCEQCAVQVSVYYNIPYDEFAEQFDDAQEQYLNAYDSIEIDALFENKKKVLYAFETA